MSFDIGDFDRSVRIEEQQRKILAALDRIDKRLRKVEAANKQHQERDERRVNVARP